MLLAIAICCAAVRSDCWITAGVVGQQVVILDMPGPPAVAATLAAGRVAALAARGAVVAGRRRAPHACGRSSPHYSMRGTDYMSRRPGGSSKLRR